MFPLALVCPKGARAGQGVQGITGRLFGGSGGGQGWGQRANRALGGHLGKPQGPHTTMTAHLRLLTSHKKQVKPLEDVRHSWIPHILLERYYGWELGGGRDPGQTVGAR